MILVPEVRAVQLGVGVAVREFQFSTGGVDYTLFVDGRDGQPGLLAIHPGYRRSGQDMALQCPLKGIQGSFDG